MHVAWLTNQQPNLAFRKNTKAANGTTMKTIIKNGRIITAVDDYRADILIEDERVSVIGAKLDM